MPRLDVLVPRKRKPNEDIGPLARILIRLRGETPWKQKEVAVRAGWKADDQGYYSALETGAIRNPGDDKLRALDTAFGLEPDSIKYWLKHGPPWQTLREEGPIYDGPDWELGEGDEFIRILWPRLSTERRRQLSDYAKYLADLERA